MARKVTEGKFRNKERTMQKLLDAVGTIISKQGYTGLTVSKIASTAKVDRKLIYLYFGDTDTLIETYVRQKDYWNTFAGELEKLIEENKADFGKALALSILENQFQFFFDSEEMQKIILWEISVQSGLMREIADQREVLGSELFKITDPHFETTNMNFRSIYALLVGGIYYLILHAKANGSSFCGININETEGREEILKSLKQIVEWSYGQTNKH